MRIKPYQQQDIKELQIRDPSTHTPDQQNQQLLFQPTIVGVLPSSLYGSNFPIKLKNKEWICEGLLKEEDHFR